MRRRKDEKSGRGRKRGGRRRDVKRERWEDFYGRDARRRLKIVKISSFTPGKGSLGREMKTCFDDDMG